MSLTLSKIYSQIEEELAIYVDDSQFDRRLFYDLIISTRENSLRNEYNRLRTFNEFVLQTLNCFSLTIVDSSTCCSGLFPTGCKLLKSVNELPRTVEFHQQDGIRSIKPNNILGRPIYLVSSDRIPFLKKDGVNDNQIYAFIWDKYLYIYSLNPKFILIDSVTLRGLFVDPVEAAELGCNSGECLNDSDDFPLANWMWESTVKPIIIQKLLAKLYKKNDEANNAKDDQLEQQVNIKK